MRGGIRLERKQEARLPLLPQSLRRWLTSMLTQSMALLTAVAAVALMLALLSYDMQDPSWNSVAGAESVHNILGRFGAIVADIVRQGLGVAGFFVCFVLGAWAVQLSRTGQLTGLVWRLLLALFSMLALSVVVAIYWPAPANSVTSPPAGAVGELIWQALQPHWPDAVPEIVLPLGLLFFAFVGLLFAGAVPLADWRLAGSATKNAFHTALDRIALLWQQHVLRFVAGLMRGLAGFWRNDEQRTLVAEDVPEEEEDNIPDDAPPAQRRRPTPPRKKDKPKDKPAKLPQLPLDDSNPELPSLNLLYKPDVVRQETQSPEALSKAAQRLEATLADFGVRGQIGQAHPGPVVTLFELEPAPGTKTARVVALSDDIAREVGVTSVRVAVVPGRNAIGIELPNTKRQTVWLRELLAEQKFTSNEHKLPLALGRDIGGTPIIADLARMPHLLVAGTTGSGKSVAVNAMILSLLYRYPPSKCRFIMVDPKMLELSVYEGIPHLLAPVVTEPKKAIVALKWAVREMEERYRSMAKLGVRNIEGYNLRLAEARARGEDLRRQVQTGFDAHTGKPIFEEQPFDLTELPYIVVIVDEMADLMLVAGKDIEAAIQRLAQMARAAGIHLIMATQRPSVDVITGTIKANFPTRISFQVTSKIDSRTILGEQGAEQLLGQGDMLFMAGGGRISRVHGPFVRDEEVAQVVEFLKTQGTPEYLDAVTEDVESDEGGAVGGNTSSGDALYDKAVDIVLREGKASTSFVQRHLQIGYNRAATLIERMEKEGVVSAANHVGKREVLGRRD